MGARVVALMLVAGCGRFGFASEPPVELDAAIDGALDTPSALTPPAICSARTIGALTIGTEVPQVVRAAPLASGGFAVAIGTDTGAVHVVRVNPDGSFGGRHTPLAAGYELQGLGTLGDSVFVYALNGGTTSYLKALDPTWDAYATAQGGEPAVIDPPLAATPGGLGGWLGMKNGATISLAEVDGTGTSTGLVADYQPVTGDAASFSSSPAGIRTAIDRGDGTCETLLIAPTGVTRARETITSCKLPRVASFADDRGALVYQGLGGLSNARLVDTSAATTDPSTVLGDVQNVRVMVRDGRAWFAFTPAGSSSVQLLALAPDGATEAGTAPGLRAPFDLLPSGAFWLEGLDLHGGTPCVE